jgi:hypothetical protein
MMMMTRVLVLAAVLLLQAPCLVGAQEAGTRTSADEVQRKLVGNWELVVYESFPATGGSVDNRYIGRILYDRAGNMSAIGMPIDFPARRAADPENTPTSQGFAYFARIELFPEEDRIIHHVIGSPTAAGWVGTGLVRYYEFEGDDVLKLSIRNAEGRTTGTLTWRRLD